MLGALVLSALFIKVPPPAVSAAPVQDSPVLVRIAPKASARRLRCSVDGHRARACARRTRLKLAPGRHTVAAWAVARSGQASAKRRVAVVVPQRAPAGVTVGGQPVGIAASGSTLWVSDGSGGNVVRVDADTHQVTARIAVGGQLGGIAASPGAVWVSVFGGGEVARIDPATNAVVARIALGGQPTAVAFDAGGSVWVGNLDGRVSRIDPATDHVVAQPQLSSGVSTLLPLGSLLWAGLQGGTLVSLDPAANAATGQAVTVAPDVDAVVGTPQGLWASTFDGLAARVDSAARRVVRRVRIPGRGGGIAFDGGRVWVSAYDHAYAVALSPASGKLLGAVHTGGGPRDSIAVGGTVWVVDQFAGKLTPITAQR
jgi:sugar lactone lactonase YvrE